MEAECSSEFLVLQVAGEALVMEQRGGARPDGSAITQLQVLEVAAVEAERRLLDADRCVPLAPTVCCFICRGHMPWDQEVSANLSANYSHLHPYLTPCSRGSSGHEAMDGSLKRAVSGASHGNYRMCILA
jgi:hypothetical protein